MTPVTPNITCQRNVDERRASFAPSSASFGRAERRCVAVSIAPIEQGVRSGSTTPPGRPSCVRTASVARGSAGAVSSHRFTAAILVSAVLASAAEASIPVPGAPGVQVIPADEVLANYTMTAPDGSLLFTDAEGVTWRLVTDLDDPEITNPSAAGFFPADVDGVVAALDALPDEFLWAADCRVYVLPYPRSGAVSSSATRDAIYLSPGVQPFEDGPVLRAMVVHEFGHVVHHTLLPDASYRWAEYRTLRGIEDEGKFHASADHAYRPHEIFAEDFRVLFGDDLAAGDGSVENPELDSPQYDLDLIAFFESLPQLGSTADVALRGATAASWRVFPNPTPLRGQLHLEWRGVGASAPSAARAELVDAAGRRVGELDLVSDGAGRWTAPLAGLDGLRAGAYWLVLRGADGVLGTAPVRVVP